MPPADGAPAAPNGVSARTGDDRILVDDFDPWAEETFTSAHEAHKEMRAKCPVAHSSKWGGFWALYRYDDVLNSLQDSPNFTTSVQNTVPKFAFTGRRPPLHFDPPEHTSYRRIINRFFSTAKMDKIEAAVRRDVIHVMEPLIAAGRADMSVDYAQKFPAFVFAEFFNLDRDLSLLIKEVSAAYVAAIQIVDDETVKRLSRRLYEIAAEIIEVRRVNPMDPKDDLTSALMVGTHEGEPLPPEYILGCVRQLLVTGMVAPSVFIGNMFVHLAGEKALQQQLRANPDQLGAAIEEYLRLYTPYRGMARTSRTDVVIGGRKIKAGEPVALVYASANRDESVFPNGDDFELNRPNIKDHIAFGGGPHTCPGAPLARMMFRITLEEALARTTDWDIDGEIKMARWAEWGTNSVPVRFVTA